jgi:hypothetical protein
MVPSKEERAGAHQNSGSTVRRRKRHRAAAFVGGVAPVVVDVRGGVLQHRCRRGKLRLAPIWEMAKLGGRSPERGGRWRRSDGVWRGGGAPVSENRRGGRLGYGNKGAALRRRRVRQWRAGCEKSLASRRRLRFNGKRRGGGARRVDTVWRQSGRERGGPGRGVEQCGDVSSAGQRPNRGACGRCVAARQWRTVGSARRGRRG